MYAQSKIIFFVLLLLSWVDISASDAHFKRGMVTLTFDDGYLSDYEVVMPLLKKYDLKATFYICPGFIDKTNRLTTAHVKKLRKLGHEIGSHTLSHHHLTHLTFFGLRKELLKSKRLLEEILHEPVEHMAVPYGNYNSRVLRMIKKYYRSNRSVREGYNIKNHISRYSLYVKNVDKYTTLNEVETWLEQAEKHRVWLILVYHEIRSTDERWSTTPENFHKHLQTIKKYNLKVAPIGEALEAH